MMDRRSFLTRSTLALAGGLLVGDAALEAFERLTHRKVFALGGWRSVVAADLSWDKVQDRSAVSASLTLRWSDGTVSNQRRSVTSFAAYGNREAVGIAHRQLSYVSGKMVQDATRESGQDVWEMIRPQLSGLARTMQVPRGFGSMT